MTVSHKRNESPLVSVIVLSYNGGELLKSCIKSVLKTDYPNFELIIVDNASIDGSIDYIEEHYSKNLKVRVIKSNKNLGFAEGNNSGVKYAKGKYVTFLNQDTKVDPNWLKEVVKIMEKYPSIGVAQAKLLKMDDPSMLDSAGHYIDRLCIVVVKGHNERDLGQYDKLEQIFGATGAAMTVKKSIFDTIKGFDSEYFILFEESDLCWRTWLIGYHVIFIPKSIVYHKGGSSREKIKIITNLYYSRRNRIISMAKNYELKNLMKYFLLSLIMFFSMGLISKYRGEYMLAYIKAVLDCIINFPDLLLKRQTIQKNRKIKDKELFNRGIIKPFNLIHILKHKGY